MHKERRHDSATHTKRQKGDIEYKLKSARVTPNDEMQGGTARSVTAPRSAMRIKSKKLIDKDYGVDSSKPI